MTTATSPPEPSPTARSGFHVPVWVVAVLGGLLIAVLGLGIGARIARNHDHGDHMRRFGERFGHQGGGGHPVLGLLLVLIVLGLAVTGVVLLVRARRSSTVAAAPIAAAGPSGAAEQLLAERFARGEIDAAEFQSRRDALRG